jgi:hypothetical protein
MLFHLDVKEPGLDAEIARILDETDMWDHVVAVNTDTLPLLLKNPKLKLIKYKGGVYEARRDLDPATVKQALAKPGQILILEDPRVAAQELKRNPYQPVPIPAEVFANWSRTSSPPLCNTTNPTAPDYLRLLQKRVNPDSVPELLALLRANTLDEHREPPGNAEYERRRAERILERAWAAGRLGQIAKKSRGVIPALETQAQSSSLHPDWIFEGLDGHTAARALGRLGATESVPELIATFRRVDPALATIRNPAWTNTPLAWVDWRKMYILPVLGELRCDASHKFLTEYVSLGEDEAGKMSIPQFEEATKALLRQQLNRQELLGLLKSDNSAVRGAAILECLDHPTRDRTASLREAAPWALALPRAKH